MKPKIIGATVGSPLPKPDLMQTDPTKGDYVKGRKEFFEQLSEEKLPEAINAALEEAKKSGQFDGYTPQKGIDYTDGDDGITPHIGENGNWYLGETDTGKPSRGEPGYTPQKGVDYTDGYTPQKGIDYTDGDDGITPHIGENGNWYLGETDTGKPSRGEPGYTPQKGIDYTDGTSVTVSSVSESTADGGSNVVTFSDGKTLTVKNGSKGSTGNKGDKGDTGPQGPAYTLNDTDKNTIAAAVKASLTTENWTFTLEDGSTVTKAVYVG